MNKEMLDIVNDLSKKPTTELALQIMELSSENLILEQQCKKQKEVIDKAMSILKNNFVYDCVRSCDTADGVGYDEIDTEHFTYRVYELLKEVSE